MSDVQEMVAEFHEAFALADRRGEWVEGGPPFVDIWESELRLDLIWEEVLELEAAIDSSDIVEIADALADIAYVTFGVALVFGLDLNAVIREVHRSNMTKLGEDGKPIYRHDGKVEKGPGFEKPRIAEVLAVA